MRIIPLIRRHASLLALLSALLGLAAAPYLVPENPDSAVFRSGTLGLLLALACYFPLKHALVHADLRTLVCAAGFGLLLSCALGLGAELRFYGGLLPGMGSMLRRLAVPLMSTPLLGGLAARCMLPSSPGLPRRSLKLPMYAYMAILLLCWLPLLIAYYPGMLNYDFPMEYQQWLDGQWDARHPLLYIVLCYAVYGMGSLLEQPELAILAVTLLRMLALAAALSYSCIFVHRRAGAWACALMTAAYALLPIFSVMAVSSAKDTPFAAALLVLSLLCWELIEDPQAFLASKRRCAVFLLTIVCTCHMRKNGVAALLMLPTLIVVLRGYRAKATKLCAAGVLASALLGAGMNALLQPVSQPSFQTYSLPAQQLVRAYHLGDMTEAEREELRSWYVDSDWGLQLLPHLADAAKGSLDPQKLDQHGDAFLDLWARVGKRNVRVYTEAFLLLNIGSWYPDDTTHATVYQPYGLDKGYLQTDEFDAPGVTERNLLPSVRSLYERICRRNEYLKYPLVSTLFCTATPLWIILFACALLIARRQARCLPAVFGVLILHLSYLLGPCTLPRYMLPLFCLAPAALLSALYAHSPAQKEAS